MIFLLKKHFPSKIKKKIKLFFKNFKDSLCYVFLRKSQERNNFTNILFVCKGNICRSPFAELYFKKINNLDLNIASCGLDVDQGSNSPKEAILVADEYGIDMSTNISKSIHKVDLEKFDLLISMELNQHKRIIMDYPQYKKKARLLRDFLPWPQRLQCNIADPYGGDLEGFKHCFITIRRALDRMMVEIYGRP